MIESRVEGVGLVGPDSITAEIADFVEGFRTDKASSFAREQATLHLADTVGVALAAALHPATQITLRQVSPRSEGATLWGQKASASVLDAAWANGVAAHALDFDDTSMLSGAHLSASVVPAVFAIGESLGAPGADVLAAYMVGHEVGEKVGHTLPSMESYARGWHGTAIHGIMASVAGAARILGLRGRELVMAFGIAASMAAGLRRNTGTMTTALHSGNAARNGLLAALLAKEGFTANGKIFDGQLSYWDAFRWEGSPGRSVRLFPLGNPLGFEKPGVGIKPYPCGSPLFSVAEGMLSWKRELDLSAEDVESVHCAIHPNAYEIAVFDPPIDTMQAKACCVYGRLGLEEFNESAMTNSEVIRIMGLVDARELEGYEWTTDIRYECEPPTLLELKLRGEPALTKFVDKVKGYPGGGLLASDDIRAKFLACSTDALGARRAEQLLETLLRPEQVGDWREVANRLAS